LDGSGAVHTVLPWEAFGGHVPSGGSEMYWFDQSIPIHPGFWVGEYGAQLWRSVSKCIPAEKTWFGVRGRVE
jgi:hypothetical protein